MSFSSRSSGTALCKGLPSNPIRLCICGRRPFFPLDPNRIRSQCIYYPLNNEWSSLSEYGFRVPYRINTLFHAEQSQMGLEGTDDRIYSLHGIQLHRYYYATCFLINVARFYREYEMLSTWTTSPGSFSPGLGVPLRHLSASGWLTSARTRCLWNEK
jgi:hypothetical protein